MNLEEQWIVGFVDGEGCFHVSVTNNTGMTLKKQVLPEFTVVQHQRNIQVLYALKSFFKCGVVRTNHEDRKAYRVRGHQNLFSTIIPFFEKHKLKTTKRLDFEMFRDVVILMEHEKHLTVEGLQSIEEISQKMNRKGVTLKG